MGKSKVSKTSRSDRDKEIAKFVKDHGGEPYAAVKHFNVGFSTVVKACNERGVKFKQYPVKAPGSPDEQVEQEEQKESGRKRTPIHPRTAQIVEDLLAGLMTQTQIARKHKVTRAWVSWVWKRLKVEIQAGKVQLKPRKKPEFPWQSSYLTTATPYQHFLLAKKPRVVEKAKPKKTKK
jgi:hypothetical protein